MQKTFNLYLLYGCICIVQEKKSLSDLFNFIKLKTRNVRCVFRTYLCPTPSPIITPLLFNKLARYKELSLFIPPLQRHTSIRTPPSKSPIFSGPSFLWPPPYNPVKIPLYTKETRMLTQLYQLNSSFLHFICLVLYLEIFKKLKTFTCSMVTV